MQAKFLLKFGKICDTIKTGNGAQFLGQSKGKVVGSLNPRGGEAMSGYEVIMTVVGIMVFLLMLFNTMINLADKFSKRK